VDAPEDDDEAIVGVGTRMIGTGDGCGRSVAEDDDAL
jgi:hypothetical protein